MDIDLSGIKWFIVGIVSLGVLVFNEGVIEDLNDDCCKEFNFSNSVLIINGINCFVVDFEGDVWVGIDDGVIIFECGGSVFEFEC